MMSSFLRKAGLFLIEISFVLTIILSLYSWIGSEMGSGTVSNVLSYAGIRWMLRNTMDNFISFPLAHIILLLIAAGCAVRSGLYLGIRSFIVSRRRLTVRERAGLQMMVLLLAIFAICISFGLLASDALLLSITGELSDSPLTCGWVVILAAFIVISSVLYGIISGHLRNRMDVFDSLCFGIANASGIFAVMFMLCVLFQTVFYIFYY